MVPVNPQVSARAGVRPDYPMASAERGIGRREHSRNFVSRRFRGEQRACSPLPLHTSDARARGPARTLFAGLVLLLATLAACTNDTKKSAALAKEHVRALGAVAREDARQVRTGLPLGAAELAKILPSADEGELDPQVAREALEKARNKVQDLRVAKSTFFALVAPSGVVVRNDQQQDRMAGKNLLDAFPGLRPALTGSFAETRGSMPEAAEVRGKPDAQWVAAVPVRSGDRTRALYTTGWSWSAYAYRLENAVRSAARGATSDPGKMPLLYAFVIVDADVYGAPVSPEVNARAVHDLALLTKLVGTEPIGVELEITGRSFGLGAERVPELGDKVAIAVLRSET
jgi:hypothetical protein